MSKLVETKITKISEGEIVYVFREAWKQLFGEYPLIDSIALIWAQWAQESGRGAYCRNYNFCNIKKVHSPDDGHDWCMYRCNELINGKWEWFDPPHIQTNFRAYPNAIDGAVDYLRFLSQKKRYQKAWEKVLIGDAAGFSHELSVANYYTAPEKIYTPGIIKLATEFKKKADRLMAYQPEKVEPKPEPIPPLIPTEIEVAPKEPIIEPIEQSNIFLQIITAILKFLRLIR